VIEYMIFLRGLANQWGRYTNEIWHKGSIRGEDDAWTLNKRIAQRKHAIPHYMMKRVTCATI